MYSWFEGWNSVLANSSDAQRQISLIFGQFLASKPPKRFGEHFRFRPIAVIVLQVVQERGGLGLEVVMVARQDGLHHVQVEQDVLSIGHAGKDLARPTAAVSCGTSWVSAFAWAWLGFVNELLDGVDGDCEPEEGDFDGGRVS